MTGGRSNISFKLFWPLALSVIRLTFKLSNSATMTTAEWLFGIRKK
jgi:hypothetical protein